jgi:hypothetical protein
MKRMVVLRTALGSPFSVGWEETVERRWRVKSKQTLEGRFSSWSAETDAVFERVLN